MKDTVRVVTCYDHLSADQLKQIHETAVAMVQADLENQGIFTTRQDQLTDERIWLEVFAPSARNALPPGVKAAGYAYITDLVPAQEPEPLTKAEIDIIVKALMTRMTSRYLSIKDRNAADELITKVQRLARTLKE